MLMATAGNRVSRLQKQDMVSVEAYTPATGNGELARARTTCMTWTGTLYPVLPNSVTLE